MNQRRRGDIRMFVGARGGRTKVNGDTHAVNIEIVLYETW